MLFKYMSTLDLQSLQFDFGWSNPLREAEFPSNACLVSPPSPYFVLWWGQVIVCVCWLSHAQFRWVGQILEPQRKRIQAEDEDSFTPEYLHVLGHRIWTVQVSG